MKSACQQGVGGFPVYCTGCHMYDYLPGGQKSWMCARCKELLALRERVRTLEAKVAELEKQRQIVRHGDQTLRDFLEVSHSVNGSAVAVKENEGLGESGHHTEDKGNMPSEGTSSSVGERVSFRIKEPTLGGAGGRLLVVGDSILRQVDSWVAKPRSDRMVTCLPGAKVADITRVIDRLVDSAGEESAVVVHVGTNDVGKCSREVLEQKFRLLGRRLKARTSKVAFSEVLPVPRVGPERQSQIRSLNAWMRRWCKEEGFKFVRHWDSFWDKRELYKRDGLHLSREGTRLLALKIKKVAEQFLN